MLEHHPLHVRRKIALFATLIVGGLLVLILVLWYRHRGLVGNRESGDAIKQFYNTISSGAQSFLPEK